MKSVIPDYAIPLPIWKWKLNPPPIFTNQIHCHILAIVQSNEVLLWQQLWVSLCMGIKRDGKFKYQKLMLFFFGCQKWEMNSIFISQFSNGWGHCWVHLMTWILKIGDGFNFYLPFQQRDEIILLNCTSFNTWLVKIGGGFNFHFQIGNGMA